MIIEKKRKFTQNLKIILRYIAKDKPSASVKFKKELDVNIKRLANNPYIYRKSYYFDDENYRELIHKGYTIIYKIEVDRILVLEIFKWQNR